MLVKTHSSTSSIYPLPSTSSASMGAVAGLPGPPSSSPAHDDFNQPQPCDLCYQLPTPTSPSPLPHLSLAPSCSELPTASSTMPNPRTTPCSDVARPSPRDVGRLRQEPVRVNGKSA
ncbi:hypothetical protein GALMADRAFT_775415 [Galerina marginata CBS 339.88]|uniref:Uncharacterized protein n=1 Tax=Galerina marginata (strain CBS 339.88) TaxID=685588 RepID=A0A067SML3_GALM3|nr:hypothetical protein GALMADRAFT_775415 [Galerina marginata CBS 339.88]